MKERKRITCEDVELLMQDYLDGYLLPGLAQELEGHVVHCVACRDELISMKRLEEQLEWAVPVDVPAGLERSITSRLPAHALAPAWALRVTKAAGLGMATVMTMLLVVLLAYSPYRKAGGAKEVEIVYAAPGARSVNVVGDFNGWDTSGHRMTRGPDGNWRLSLRLPPGLYQYNFYIDGQRWADDPGSQALVSDGFGGRNALLFVEG